MILKPGTGPLVAGITVPPTYPRNDDLLWCCGASCYGKSLADARSAKPERRCLIIRTGFHSSILTSTAAFSKRHAGVVHEHGLASCA